MEARKNDTGMKVRREMIGGPLFFLRGTGQSLFSHNCNSDVMCRGQLRSRRAAAPSAALTIIVLRSNDRVISRRICRVLRARTAGGSVARHALDWPQNAGNRADGQSPDDDDNDDDNDVGSRAYLIGPPCNK